MNELLVRNQAAFSCVEFMLYMATDAILDDCHPDAVQHVAFSLHDSCQDSNHLDCIVAQSSARYFHRKQIQSVLPDDDAQVCGLLHSLAAGSGNCLSSADCSIFSRISINLEKSISICCPALVQP